MMENVGDPNEKKRLDKLFGMERAKAQARIQKLSEYCNKIKNILIFLDLTMKYQFINNYYCLFMNS